jgi:peptide/nickel transport system permease protein
MTRVAKTSAAILMVLIVASVLGPLLARGRPETIGDVLAGRFVPPFAFDARGGFHPFGTDSLGRDLLARMLLAGRISLGVGVLGSLLAGAWGLGVGALAGWRGGWVDRALMALCDALLAIPRLVLLLLCAALWKPGLGTVVIVLAATGWMAIARLTRAEVIAARSRPYVDAARALGARSARTLWRHVIPNAIGPALAATTLGVGSAIMLESGLSFLGLGVQPPTPSWGNMIAAGRDVIVTAPWVALVPGLALIATTVAATLLGDWLRDRLAGERETRVSARGS